MKKPVVNYRNFRLSKLRTPEFYHLNFLFGWIGYFALYFLTERFIPVDECYVVHSSIDDLIPFNELFVIPYVLWYLLIVVSLLYFALYNPKSFKNLMIFIIITQISAMAIYIAFPNMQDLRPSEFSRDNVLVDLVKLLYTVDTNTNVCPSLHVAYSIAIASVWAKEKGVNVFVKIFIALFALLICASTVFIKQHSIIDFFAALPICLFAEIFVFGKSFYLPKFKKK